MVDEQPWPKTEEELLDYIHTNLKKWSTEEYEKQTEEERSQSYNDSADSMWKIALAAFNYAASEVGASGFQASWAALKLYGEITTKRGPFAVIDGENLLYPQYNIRAQVEEYIQSWTQDWAKEEAKKRLEGDLEYVSPTVINHWKKLAGDFHDR